MPMLGILFGAVAAIAKSCFFGMLALAATLSAPFS